MHSKQKKIMFIFGTRPEAIKLAPVIDLFKKCKKFEIISCITAQHRSMLDQVLNIFKIKADHDLNLMTNNQTLCNLSARIFSSMDSVFAYDKPDLIIVHGDTTSTLIGSLSGFYNNIPIAHIEAGLRTQDLQSPFPEELNRQLVSRIADLHFAPTELNRNNLLQENIPNNKIYITGNTVIDALNIIINRIENNQTYKIQLTKKISKILGFSILDEKFILVTCHRRENFEKGIKNVCEALIEIAREHKDFQIVFPVHLNPNILNIAMKLLSGIDNIRMVEPFSYDQFCYLLKSCFLILTDSGGIQEEALTLSKPTLLLRQNTERPEGVATGCVKIIGAKKKNIIEEISLLISNKKIYDSMCCIKNPYGDGDAAYQILEGIEEYYR